MADNKFKSYSFYIPAGDKALESFVEAQSNLSMSIRLLLKGFMANCNGKHPDVPNMDLKELLEGMDISAEDLQEIRSGENIRERRSRKAASAPASKGDEEIGLDAAGDDDEYDADSDKSVVDIGADEEEPEFGDGSGEDDAVPAIEDDKDDEPEEAGDGTAETEPKSVQEPEPAPAPKPEPKPAAKPEPKKSVRDEYNSSRDGEDAGMDEIFSLMGGM